MRRLRLRGCVVDLGTGQVHGEQPSRLTTRERTLLAWLAERPGRDVSREELLQDAFGYHPDAVSRAVDKAMYSLRNKVERDPSEPEHLITVSGRGYRFVPLRGAEVRLPTGPPAELDAFVGRREALEQVRRGATEPGLLTVCGPGGIGKTRLVVRALADADPTWVDCASAAGRDDLLRCVAVGLAVSMAGADPSAERIGQALAARGDRSLLVLDNLEHLVAHADVIALWRQLAPRSRVIATSREVLNLPGEQVLRLPPLSIGEGVALLVERCSRRGLQLQDDERARLPELVDRLDGLPLALELAAARVGVLGVQALLQRLDSRLELLSSRSRGAPARHQTLTAVLDDSWELLDAVERLTLAELSVFPAAFSHDDAAAVCSAPADGRALLDVLERLVDASLVQSRLVERRARLSLLEVVRLYAGSRLRALGAEVPALRAYVVHYAELGRRHREVPSGGGTRDEALAETARQSRRLAEVGEHVIAAARIATDHGWTEEALATAATVLDLVTTRGPQALAVEITRGLSALPCTPHQQLRADLLLGRALAAAGGDARDLLEHVAEDARDQGEIGLEAGALLALGSLHYRQGRREQAEACFERCIEVGSERHGRGARHKLGVLAQVGGDFERSLSLLEQIGREHERAGDFLRAGIAHTNAGMAAMRLNQLDRAEWLLQASREVFEALDVPVGALNARASLALVAARRGRVQEAAAQLRDIADGFRELGERRSTMITVGELGGLLVEHDPAAARPCADELGQLAWELGDHRAAAAADLLRARIAHEGAHHDEALDLVDRVLAATEAGGFAAMWLSGALLQAQVLHAAGRSAEALVAVERLEGRLGDLGLPPTSELGREATRVRRLVEGD